MEKWHLVSVTSTKVMEFRGKSTDVADLPTDVEIGSFAYCIDSGDVYMYDGENWVEQ